jgi:hypothetical protein
MAHVGNTAVTADVTARSKRSPHAGQLRLFVNDRGRSYGRLAPNSLHPSGLRPSGLRPSGLRPSGLRPSRLGPSGLRPSGLRPSGLRPSGLRPSGLRPSRLLRRACDCDGKDAADGWRLAWQESPGPNCIGRLLGLRSWPAMDGSPDSSRSTAATGRWIPGFTPDFPDGSPNPWPGWDDQA